MTRSHLPGAETARRMARLERTARLLDTRFRLPLIGVRVGWDSILGLVPGVGDLATTLPAGWMMIEGYRMGARKRTLARMGANAVVDLVIGGIPLIGDLFDIAFKSHTRNLALLQADMQRKRPRASQQEPAHA